jgi:hypothetical protein
MIRISGLVDRAKALLRRSAALPGAGARADLDPRIPKIIWSCWLQGRENAPRVVEKCLLSWERKNPGWQFRCLDATTIGRYVPLKQYVDLDTRSITAASLSDIVRILLLHEFGGVWVDATLFCNAPLDDWLPPMMNEGFFAFTAMDPIRPLSSWLLCAAPKNYLVSAWCRRTVEYWSARTRTADYFWFHHLFREMCETDSRTAEAWSRVPKMGAEKPHALQLDGQMYRPAIKVRDRIDWNSPVFKLTHRIAEQHLKPGSLLEYFLEQYAEDGPQQAAPPPVRIRSPSPKSFASLKVGTENLGDHIQIIAGLRLLARLGIQPTRYLDRDNEMQSAPGLDQEEGPVGILVNGWFKNNPAEWPPHPKLSPLLYSFHIRPSFCPELISDASIDFYRRHQPIGCRDAYTEDLLRSKGVDAFVSNCVSLTFPRRIDDPATQTEVFVVSRDERIKAHLPASIGPYTFITQYSGSNDFGENMVRAEELLETYRSRAKLIVTSMLHCALPAIAMGIPVIVFYPVNEGWPHTSDRERFSSLERLVPVLRLEETEKVNWNPAPVDISGLKLRILDGFYAMAAERWQLAAAPPIRPIAPSSILPAPEFQWQPDQADA